MFYMNENNLVTVINTILDRSNNKKIDLLYKDMSKYQRNIFDSWQIDEWHLCSD